MTTGKNETLKFAALFRTNEAAINLITSTVELLALVKLNIGLLLLLILLPLMFSNINQAPIYKRQLLYQSQLHFIHASRRGPANGGAPRGTTRGTHGGCLPH